MNDFKAILVFHNYSESLLEFSDVIENQTGIGVSPNIKQDVSW